MISIAIDKLYKEYDSSELYNGLSLNLNSGDSYALLSPSGSGKTTLLRIIAGLTEPDSGSIFFFKNSSPVKRPGIAMVFQEDRLCEDFSAVENIYFATGMERSAAEAELYKLLPEAALHKPVRTLSGGQRRRLCIARAMNAPDSGIILMDEPFTGLDYETKLLCCSYILNKKADRTLILSTHDESDIELLKLTPVRL